MRAYGNWCGPGWTAGQYKDSSELTDEDRNVPAIDELDAHCKTHDILLHDHPDKADEINQLFIENVKGMGITGALFALAVSAAGPTPQSNLQQNDNMSRRFRNQEEEYKQYEQRNEEDINNQLMGLEDKNVGNDLETPQRVRSKSQKISPLDKPMSAARRFPWRELAGLEQRRSLPNNRPTTKMDVIMEPVQQNRAMASRSDTEQGMSDQRETPIIYHSPQYLQPETLTVLLPTTFYLAGVLGTAYQALDLRLRCNDYKAPLTTAIQAPAAPIQNIGPTFAPGFWNRKIQQWQFLVGNSIDGPLAQGTGNNTYNKGNTPNAVRWTFNNFQFPKELTPGQQPQCHGARFYEQMYQYYTVIGCEYEIILENTCANYYQNNDIKIAEIWDTYKNGKLEGRTADIMPLGDVEAWKNIKWHYYQNKRLGEHSPSYYTIKGTYKPGLAKRMVETDGDSKRWYKTSLNVYDEAPGYMVEDLHLMFFPHEFNTVNNKVVQSFNQAATPIAEIGNAKTTFNMKVTMKYIVQYKDLIRAMSEFNNDAADLSIPTIWPMPSSNIYKTNVTTI
jgi:hypothetical protein